MKHLLWPALFVVILSCQSADDPSFTGLWQVKKVTMGNQSMTPLGKWTRLEKNGNYLAGNGWLQNSTGTWTFNPDKKTLSLNDTYGLEDEFGAFEVEVDTDSMIWEREENDQLVRVVWEPVDELPQTYADLLSGLWENTSDTHNEDIMQVKQLFFRWDNVLMATTVEGRRSFAHWISNAHHPEITILQDNMSKLYHVEVTENRLQLTDRAEGITITYQRIHQFLQ